MKFQVGEIALVARNPSCHVFVGFVAEGDEVEVVRVSASGDLFDLVGPTVDGKPPVPPWLGCHYECRHPAGFHFLCDDPDLRKRPQRGIPDEVRAWFDVPRKVGEPA